MAKHEAVAAIVTGNDQHVGFRALVMKQAIEYNLAGSASNDMNSIVHFTLQGDKKRIDKALATIQDGTRRSSDLKITTVSVPVDPALDKFTIVDWTSSSRTSQTSIISCFNSGSPIRKYRWATQKRPGTKSSNKRLMPKIGTSCTRTTSTSSQRL